MDKYEFNLLMKIRDAVDLLNHYFGKDNTLREIEEGVTKDLQEYVEAKNEAMS